MAKTKSATTVENVVGYNSPQETNGGALSRSEFLGQSGFLDFKGLCERVPLSPRTLRSAIKRKQIPHIRLPKSRRLLFSWEAVRLSLLRFSIEE